MLPDYPNLKQEIKKRLTLIIRKNSESDPLLQMVGRVKHYEGDRMSNKSVDGYESESPYTEFTSPISISNEEMITQGPDAFYRHGLALAKDVERQTIGFMFTQINEVAEKIGNTMDGHGQPFSAEMYFQLLGKVAVSFNDDGTPRMPTLITPPAMQEKVKEVLNEIENDPKLKERFDQIIRMKKEEWDVSESDRKLVD